HREPYDKNYIHIVYALDKKILSSAVVSVASIVDATADPSMLFFHFVTVKFPAEPVSAMISSCVRGSFRYDAVEWTDIPEVIASMQIRDPMRQDLAAPANYARFYVGALYPHIDRFLYIDTDTFVSEDIKQLWEFDIGSNVLGLRDWCKDNFPQIMFKKHYNEKQPEAYHIMHSNHSDCFPNAGVMIVNQRRFEELKILEKIEALVVKNRKEFVYSLGSQPLVTLTCWDLYTPIPQTWNGGTKRDAKDCCALDHYAGHPKPWEKKAKKSTVPRIVKW
ncbi:unnamed protein product, partial [Ectocarpus fasciculatus]